MIDGKGLHRMAITEIYRRVSKYPITTTFPSFQGRQNWVWGAQVRFLFFPFFKCLRNEEIMSVYILEISNKLDYYNIEGVYYFKVNALEAMNNHLVEDCETFNLLSYRR